MTRILRAVGWTLVVTGCIVLLYVVYLLWFTDLSANASQRELAEVWQREVPEPGPAPAPEPVDDERDDEGDDEGDAVAEPVVPGDAYAALWFERDGERIVQDEVLYVVEGVTPEHLRLGPGHYPASAAPGEAGNLAVAGHRTTYGRPFWSLDQLAAGDTIHVLDRSGNEWVYAYREQRVVAPHEVWVVADDPLETGEPTITLTTCHPRFSAAQRLIAWGELVGEPRDP